MRLTLSGWYGTSRRRLGRRGIPLNGPGGDGDRTTVVVALQERSALLGQQITPQQLDQH